MLLDPQSRVICTSKLVDEFWDLDPYSFSQTHRRPKAKVGPLLSFLTFALSIMDRLTRPKISFSIQLSYRKPTHSRQLLIILANT